MGKATIVKPKDRMFHNREMPDGVFKVNVASVLAGFEDLPPPVPVDDDETPKMIGACKSWFLPWPKSLLRLEAPSITPMPPSQEGMNTTPPTKLPAPVVAGDSGRREGEPPLVPDDVAPVVKEANVDDDMEDDDDDPDKYFNTAYDDGGLMAQDDEDSGYEHGDDDLMLPDLPEPERPKAECKKSLFKRSSQETPPDAASTQQQPEGRPLISPTTLGVVVREGMVGSLPPPAKKQRRRPDKKGPKGARAASSSQPPLKPRVVDRIPVEGAKRFHVAGDPILPAKALEHILNNDLRRLHEDVLAREKSLLIAKDPGYPLYAAQVPGGKLYVERWPANKFILRFDYIYDMFHMTKLDFQFIRMYALYLNYFIRIENIKYICVADPYYMHESFLAVCKEHRDYASKYLGEFMIANKDKEVILLPYHPT